MLIVKGKGGVTLDFITESLSGDVVNATFIKNIAPASGLHLHKVGFK